MCSRSIERESLECSVGDARECVRLWTRVFGDANMFDWKITERTPSPCRSLSTIARHPPEPL